MIEELLDVLSRFEHGLTKAELLKELRQVLPGVQPTQVERALRTAIQRGSVCSEGNRVILVNHEEEVEDPVVERQGTRVIAFDVESIVRLTSEPPDYKEARIFQLAAVRCGRDKAWCHEQRSFNAYVDLPDDQWEIHSDAARDLWERHHRPMADVLEDFRVFIEDADLVVAYNGTGVDFPLITAAFAREEIPELDAGRFVDAYYLALALWPTPPRQHRLRELAVRVDAKVQRLQWHNALDDSVMLAQLLMAGARHLRTFDSDVRGLLRSVTEGSSCWDLLFNLARVESPRRTFTDSEVANTISSLLVAKPRRRKSVVPGAALVELSVPRSLWVDGHVSPYELALAAAPGRSGERRPAQDQMARVVQGWIDDSVSGLVEAPTGTGKSYAMLANALEWLSRNPDNRAIISTFTKQLQAQMASDIEALSAVIPKLDEVSDMVKGQSNRLSLRALATALADCASRQPNGPQASRRAPFARDPRYRELLAYLTLRLGAPATLAEQWEGRSVDRPDIPPFFFDYIPRASLYLYSLSQAAAGDYGAQSTDPLVDHTDDVAEAIANHRLIIANHALLLSNVNGLDSTSDSTVLFVDEAHMLEDAATSAMTATLVYSDVEQLPTAVARWLEDAARHPVLDELRVASRQLDLFLENAMVPGCALLCFDGATGDPGSRSVSLASPREGAIRLRHQTSLIGAIGNLEGLLKDVERPLLAYLGTEVFRSLDHFAAERFFALRTKVSAAYVAAQKIVLDAQAVIGIPVLPAPEVNNQGDVTPEGEDVEPGAEASFDEEATDETTPDQATLDLLDEQPDDDQSVAFSTPPAPNRVVWAKETAKLELAVGVRRLQFDISSSPISLPAELEWRSFLALIPRTYFVSATLTVAGEWHYIRRRLGVSEDVAGIVLESPFDIARQARLVCFEDFPSWAEHERLAVRTLSWQVAGYAREVVTRDEGAWAWRHGAMVLTTSTQVSVDVGLELESVLGDSLDRPPLIVAKDVGNARAIEAMKSNGGLVVGTRGLWQGVDISKPERLSMVWINKLPFAPFADPVISARRALAIEDAEHAGAADPETQATEDYYLPLAAISLRQAVGRLIRSREHRGVIVISDPKLSGASRLRQSYRRVLLGSLEPGLLVDDPNTGEIAGGNVVTMTEGWRRIWSFFREVGHVSTTRYSELVTEDALKEQCFTPEMRQILSLALSSDEDRALWEEGADALRRELLERGAKIGGLLRGDRVPVVLKDKQIEALEAVADGHDVLAVLPTGYGKSFAFQLPALVFPGVTIVVSPLVSLMQNQALDLNRSIGGAVRALVAPLSVSNSRLGKADVTDALSGRSDHGIRIVYVSPERLCTRQFQDLVEQGVSRGIIRRIAIDEAHTCVQWGDDFRPSFRRFENFLRRIRADYPSLRITALTATANPTVIEGLRSGLFGLPPEPEGDEPNFRFVSANPIRPELAVYRRTLGKGEGDLTVAGLVEAVLGELHDHAIFYCLTVKEVERLYSQLRTVLGPDSAQQVRRYHGRLNEAEKSAVLSEFVEAPRKGDDDFSPMVIVATSAFGLGIDRSDVRCVFVVSPPTDLSALYQQLGRAGRDGSSSTVDGESNLNAVLALGTARGFSLVKWMTEQSPSSQLLRRLAERLLAIGAQPAESEYATIDLEQVLIDQIAADFDSGVLSEHAQAAARTYDQYRSATSSVLSVLDRLGALDDLGDFPASVKILSGDRIPDDPLDLDVVGAIVAASSSSKSFGIETLHQHLTDTVPTYSEHWREPGATWSLLADFHALGYLDVSQQASYGVRKTGVEFRRASDGHSRVVPGDFDAEVQRRQRRVGRELSEMIRWYGATECANEGIAEYFKVDELPEGVCAHGVSRCSTCWGSKEAIESGESIPAVLRAFNLPKPRPASSTAAGRPFFERALDEHVEALVASVRQGVSTGLAKIVLNGSDSYFNKRLGHRVPLWPQLLYSRHRGAMPGISSRAVENSFGRLSARGAIVESGDRWRLREFVERDAARSARAQAVVS